MMIPTRILFTPPPLKIIGVIAIDVFKKETYTRKSKLTDFPIETGASISDHIINYPRQLGIEGMVGAGDALSIYNLKNIGSSFADVFYALNYLIDAKLPTVIVMGLALYTNMVIESFEVSRDKESSQGLPISIQAKEAIWVTSQILTIPNSQISGGGQAEGSLNYGAAQSGQSNVSYLDMGKQFSDTGKQALVSQYGTLHL